MHFDVVSFAAHEDAIRHIRHTVFTVEQKVDTTLDFDGLDDKAIQVLCTEQGLPVGTGRMLNDGHIGRVAVLREYRNKGVGSGLMKTLIETARTRRFREVYLYAQVTAVPFYEKLGFEATGDNFTEAGIRHTPMSLGLRP
jgi:predicted GNAT family N-acyltransferase